MSSLEGILRAASGRGGGLIAYLMGGDPNPRDSLGYARACAEAGADVIELGIPFSDPIADGPAIQGAARRALASGVTPAHVLGIAGDLAATGVPVVLMTYYNTIFVRGEEAFCRQAADRGVRGLIVPDLPLEEAEGLRGACGLHGLDLILLVTPATGEARARRIAEASRGFLYLVSRYGVTGAREELAPGLGDLVARMKAAAKGLPLAVGFGISGPAQVREVIAMGADAAVVGSALVELVARGRGPRELAAFVGALRPGSGGEALLPT